MFRKIGFHLFNQLGIMSTVFIQPENGRITCFTGPAHSKLNPILDRRILNLAHTPDITSTHFMLHKNGTAGINNPHMPLFRNFKSLIMGTILFRFLRHESDIADATHGCGIKGTMLFAKFDCGLINTGV